MNKSTGSDRNIKWRNINNNWFGDTNDMHMLEKTSLRTS